MQLPNLVYVTLRQKRLADEPDLTAEQQRRLSRRQSMRAPSVSALMHTTPTAGEQRGSGHGEAMHRASMVHAARVQMPEHLAVQFKEYLRYHHPFPRSMPPDSAAILHSCPLFAGPSMHGIALPACCIYRRALHGGAAGRWWRGSTDSLHTVLAVNPDTMSCS